MSPPLIAVLAAATLAAGASRELAALVARKDVGTIRERGPGVMDELVALYLASEPDGRADVAEVWYGLGWRSEAAKDALLRDVHTEQSRLRLQVQWALGRVSADPAVVDVLLGNMRSDGNILFRDKAACALAYDQIHLTPAQRIRLYEGLVAALEDEKPDVRHIALLALTIHTRSGDARGFAPAAAPEQRRQGVAAWRKWLAAYRAEYE